MNSKHHIAVFAILTPSMTRHVRRAPRAVSAQVLENLSRRAGGRGSHDALTLAAGATNTRT